RIPRRHLLTALDLPGGIRKELDRPGRGNRPGPGIDQALGIEALAVGAEGEASSEEGSIQDLPSGIVSRKLKAGVLALDKWQGSAPTGVTKIPTPQEAPPCLPYPLSSGSATPLLSCAAPTATSPPRLGLPTAPDRPPTGTPMPSWMPSGRPDCPVLTVTPCV